MILNLLYPAKYVDTTLRFKELPLSSCKTGTVTSLAESGVVAALGSTDRWVLDSRTIVTGSPRLRFISIIHLLGNDMMYVDLPVSCILRTSLLSEIEVNYDILLPFVHILFLYHLAMDSSAILEKV
jgi:hypothetical protein